MLKPVIASLTISVTIIAAVMLITPPTQAKISASSAPVSKFKPCDELRAEIDTKIKNNGVKDFDLLIIENDEVENHQDWQVVGSCQSGTNKIIYKK